VQVIQSISPLIGNLTNLQELQLNGNKLTTFPPELVPLPRVFSCDGVGFITSLVHHPIVQGCLKSLSKLWCNSNQLTHLPPEIGCLTSLEELYLSGNKLTHLPETIGNCLYLEILDLSGCQLQELPEQFCYMYRLIELDVGVNQVSSQFAVGRTKPVSVCPFLIVMGALLLNPS